MGPHVLIIGAGAAGIAAATRLLESGFDRLTILEAEDRIGGRICTVQRGVNVLDYGAQWVHGRDNNFIYDMADSYRLIEVEAHKENEIYYKSSGMLVPKATSDKVIGTLHDLIDSEVEMLEQYGKSLGEFYDEIFSDALKTGKFVGIDSVTCYQLYDFFIKYNNTYNATDSLYDVSGAGLLEFEDNQDEYLINWKNGGFHTFLDLLMKRHPKQNAQPIPVDDHVQLRKTVTQIDWHPDDVDRPLRVTCSDASTYDATHVIITVSLGVLQENHHTLFQPPLPSLQRNAIDGLYIGTIGKMFLEFDQPFWPVDWRGFGLLWEQSDLEELRASTHQWLESVCSFFVPAHSTNLLVAWTYGESCRTMETLLEQEVVDGLLFLLRKFLPPAQFTVPLRPRWFSRSTWYSNRNFRGSYTSRSLLSDQLQAKAADLAVPLVNADSLPVVQFAGEATHPEFYSTVQGAVDSGWREADRLIEIYREPMAAARHKL